MSNIFSIRLSNKEKEDIQKQAEQLGYKSSSDFARVLIKTGLQSLDISPKEAHLLYNSAQAVLLLREVVGLISGNEAQSTHVINNAKHCADEWKKKFKKLPEISPF